MQAGFFDDELNKIINELKSKKLTNSIDICGDFMATKEEAVNKQLKQLEKLTPEQIVNGLRLWLGNENEGLTPNQNKSSSVPDDKK